jgi:hypothetical protein
MPGALLRGPEAEVLQVVTCIPRPKAVSGGSVSTWAGREHSVGSIDERKLGGGGGSCLGQFRIRERGRASVSCG